MKILADQDVYRLTVEQLKQWGHDVITAKELGIHKSPDEELLKAGRKTRRLLITRDKDFGSLIFLRTQESVGVIWDRRQSIESTVNSTGFSMNKMKRS